MRTVRSTALHFIVFGMLNISFKFSDNSLKKMLVTMLNFALPFLTDDACSTQVLETVNSIFNYGKRLSIDRDFLCWSLQQMKTLLKNDFHFLNSLQTRKSARIALNWTTYALHWLIWSKTTTLDHHTQLWRYWKSCLHWLNAIRKFCTRKNGCDRWCRRCSNLRYRNFQKCTRPMCRYICNVWRPLQRWPNAKLRKTI